MQYLALATDYDGTLATDGHVDAVTLDALNRWKATGRKLILITGRRLDDFLNVFHHMDLFDLAVVENGAVLYSPANDTETLLGAAPPSEFVERLRDRILQLSSTEGIPDEFQTLVQKQDLQMLAVGRVIVATWTPHDRTVRELIDTMGLHHLQVIMNKGAVMILPQDVDKASGLKSALKLLNLAPEAVVGVGDAENDLAFLNLCGFSAAVSNALDEVAKAVRWVAETPRGAGVTELIDHLLAADSSG
jgi:HAD superfamily hydrolase (TIGR01484 family)